MIVTARKTLLALLLVGLAGGCPKKPETRDTPAAPFTPPEEKALPVQEEQRPADPATELAPTSAPDPSEQPGAPATEAECDKPQECKAKGKPGKGMRWTCFEGRCMAEPKGGLKKLKRRRGKG